MPEPPAWRYQKLIKPLFDIPTSHRILTGRVLTCRGSEVIERGFVEMDGALILAVGTIADLGNRAVGKRVVLMKCGGRFGSRFELVRT